jgi:hypothetical protein
MKRKIKNTTGYCNYCDCNDCMLKPPSKFNMILSCADGTFICFDCFNYPFCKDKDCDEYYTYGYCQHRPELSKNQKQIIRVSKILK